MIVQEEYRNKKGNHHELEEFYYRLCITSELTPQTVVRILVQTFGGARISIPTQKYLDRIERNRKIVKMFYGGNYRELAIRFGLTENSVRRIVHRKN